MFQSKVAPFITRRCVWRLWVGLICVVVCTPSPGLTNWAPMQKGGVASPRANDTNIRMESEQVLIRLRPESYTVEALFHFVNTGQATTEWVGCPKQGIWNYRGFDTWVDGRKVEVTEEQDAGTKTGIIERVVSGLYHYIFTERARVRPTRDERWLVLQVTFPGLTGTIMRTTYEGHYRGGSPSHMDYIIGTGSYWKDRIGRAVFIIDSSDVGGNANTTVDFRNLGVAPGPEAIGENLLRLEIRDLKPPPDAMLAVHIQNGQNHGSKRLPTKAERGNLRK